MLIASEVRVLRESLSSLLRRCPELSVVGPFPPGDGAVDIALAVAGPSPDAAAEQVRGLKSSFPGAKVVVIGASGTAGESLGYIEAGASGYILPESSPEYLIETIRMVHRGEASCPPDVLALLFERIASLSARLRVARDSDLDSLTRRELEVLQLVSDGMSNKEIAACLSLELQTVKNHVHNILEKLQVRNRREAVASARGPFPVAGDS